MKDTITDILDNQDKLSMKEFIGDKEEVDSEDLDPIETDEESKVVDIMAINPLDDANFDGLHPNHRAQMRSKVWTAQTLRNSSFLGRLGNSEE